MAKISKINYWSITLTPNFLKLTFCLGVQTVIDDDGAKFLPHLPSVQFLPTYQSQQKSWNHIFHVFVCNYLLQLCSAVMNFSLTAWRGSRVLHTLQFNTNRQDPIPSFFLSFNHLKTPQSGLKNRFLAAPGNSPITDKKGHLRLRNQGSWRLAKRRVARRELCASASSRVCSPTEVRKKFLVANTFGCLHLDSGPEAAAHQPASMSKDLLAEIDTFIS